MDDSKIKSSKKLYSGPIFELFREEVLLPNDNIVERDVVKHPGAIIILPIDSKGLVYFVRQYRHAIGSYLLELPAGTLDPNESPLECAKREISEEIGFAAKTWHDLGGIYPAPGFCNEVQQVFVASDLYERKFEADEDEILEVESYTLDQIPELIKNSEIVDGKTIATFYKAKVMGFL